jgi:hypothetical protein
MLYLISDPDHNILSYIKDDPVRPDIPAIFRVSSGRVIAALLDDDRPLAIVCISYHNTVPDSVLSLDTVSEKVDTAVFYTIWSYKPGAGRDLLLQVVPEIQKTKPDIIRFVTLSPKTEMARRFHLKNGAAVFRENPDTINYEYSPR